MGTVLNFVTTVAITTVAATASAHAAVVTGFDGQRIELRGQAPTLGSDIAIPLLAKVTDGVEFTDRSNTALPGFIVADIDIDISDDQIVFDFANVQPDLFVSIDSPVLPGQFNGLVFTDFDGTIPNIIDVMVVETLNINSPIVSFTMDQIFVNFAGLAFDDTSRVALNVTFEDASAVPLPAAAWLMGAGLAGFAGLKRRKRLASDQN